MSATKSTTTSVDSTSTQTEVQQLYDLISSELSASAAAYKTLGVTFKKLKKEMEKEQKKLAKQRPKRVVKQKPQQVTKAMRTFMTKQAGGADSDAYTRQVMMKAVSAYIKAKNLQNPENKKQWKKDATLTKLFGLQKDWYTFMQINGLLTRVVVKA